MRLTFFGAAREVTGSMHLVETDHHRILLDCGMKQGRRAEANERNSHLPFDAASITDTLLSHAHIDHSGSLPTLCKAGYRRDILCTSATRDLVSLMLLDAAKIQEQDAAYLNKKNSARGEPPITPIYTREDAEAAVARISTHEYGRPFFLGPNGPDAAVQVTFLDAGHILGSEITLLEVREGDRTVRLGFTGDLGHKGALIMRDPAPAPPLDYLIMEGTYGNRVHPPSSEAAAALADTVRSTAARGGKMVIPAFAVERTQEIVYLLNRLQSERQIPDIPVYVDSPLAIDATDVFRLHPECFDAELREFMIRHPDPWGFRQVHYTRTVEESKAINDLDRPAIVISANGMVEAGRILHHVKNTITDPRNTILFVGYQGEGTLGRRIEDGAEVAKVFGEQYQVRARIARADGFSSHADHDELLDWVRPIAHGLKGVFVVHAEDDSAEALVEDVRALGVPQVVAPLRGQSFDLPIPARP